MTYKIYIPTILIFILVSCNNTRTQNDAKQETPKALKDESSSSGFFSKRAPDDLLENLYKELVSKDTALRKLEDNIDELNESRKDTTNLFNKFNDKNQSYFSSAGKHIEEIKDSLLREKMKNLIVDDSIKYNSAIAKHSELLKIIEVKGLTISDLHNILKIVKTLPLIEKYQRDKLPGTKPLEGYIKRQDETIKYADTLIKK